MMAARRTRGQRAGLSRSAILEAALEVVRRTGASGLSMRAVATRLGVAPNALYSHVADKRALVDALLDDRLHAIDDPDPAGDPRAEVVACMTRTFDVLLAEPALVPAYLARHGSSGPRATELGRVLEDLLGRMGVAEGRTRSVVRVLVLQTIGIAAEASSEEGSIPVGDLRRMLGESTAWVVDGAATGHPDPGRAVSAG